MLKINVKLPYLGLDHQQFSLPYRLNWKKQIRCLLNQGLITCKIKKLNLPLGCSPTHSPVHSRSRAARRSCSDDPSHHSQPVENTAKKVIKSVINVIVGFFPLRSCTIFDVPEWLLWHYEDICWWHQAAGTLNLHTRHLRPPAGLQKTN